MYSRPVIKAIRRVIGYELPKSYHIGCGKCDNFCATYYTQICGKIIVTLRAALTAASRAGANWISVRPDTYAECKSWKGLHKNRLLTFRATEKEI